MLKRILKISGIILAILLVAGVIIYFKFRPKPLAISNEDRAALTIMPLPSSLKLTNGKFRLSSGFGIQIKDIDDQIIKNSVARFIHHLSKEGNITLSENGTGLSIICGKYVNSFPPVIMDESYNLNIKENGITLKANSGYGILHGLESLSQLIKKEGDNYYWPTLELTDAPRFGWRGLMIDVSRHWIPKEVILRNIEAMAAVKLNVLHLHLSDYQGFRVESKVFPKLQEAGSNGNYFSQADIHEIVEFASARGIRVIPEFDLPGHTISFLTGYPELGSAPGPYQLSTNFGVLKPVMDPTREEVYTFLDSYIGEMAQLFPDPFFHIGGDEVDYSQWEQNPSIQQFMKQNGIVGSHDLQAYFNQRIEKILQKHHKRMIGWDEILNPKLSNDIVVQSWRSHKSLFQAAQKGSKAVLSTGYYLDHKLPAAKHYSIDPEVMAGAVTIQPDSLNWQQYDISIQISENPMKSSLILYGADQNLRGLFYMMDNTIGFEKALKTGNELNFSFKSDYGQIKVDLTLTGDSLKGKMSLGFLSFPVIGKKSAGNDIAGTKPPKVEVMQPLTIEQKANILGGEAAMWTEAVSAQNIDSRIWPRMAAMAEKWWSPQELTKDTKDMYRRMEDLSVLLEKSGLQHIIGQEELLKEITGGKNMETVCCLVDVLEESKYYSRLSTITSTLIPLNEVVDAAQPESWTALKFGWLVDDYLADPQHLKGETEIRNQLRKWRDNHVIFEEAAKGNHRLEKVLPTSLELKQLSEFALRVIDAKKGKSPIEKLEKESMLSTIKNIPEVRAGTVLAVSDALKKLITGLM